MLEFSEHKYNCTGCTSCMAICPKTCITMEKDEEGFLYPVKDDGVCIHCKLCEKVCPINQKNTERYNFKVSEQKAYAALSKDYGVWKRSASGGAFTAICMNWGDDDTYIYGASWEGTFLYHKEIHGVKNIATLCKSKYVSSDLRDSFRQVIVRLKENKKVIFCGTPCQVAGLRTLVKEKYLTNLLLIDLICHGNGSMNVFQESLKAISKIAGKEVVSYEFRAKRKHYEIDHLASVVFSDGSKKYIVNDQYIQLFLNQNAIRPCCGEHCKFRDKNRPGDITLADCKGLRYFMPDLAVDKENYSTIVVNTSQGKAAIVGLENRMKICQYDINYVEKFNPLFYRQTWFSNNRDKFFKEFEKNHQEAIEKYTKPYKVYRGNWKRNIFYLLPKSIRKFIIFKIR